MKGAHIVSFGATVLCACRHSFAMGISHRRNDCCKDGAKVKAKGDKTQSDVRVFSLLCIAALVILALRTLSQAHDPVAALASSGNDDIMRFLSVRDWLAGQGWYDMRQTGVVAEGGLTLHWSRLVDAGIAAIVWPASFVVPMARAEALGLLLWPLILSLTLVVLTVRAALLHFGSRGAAAVVLCLLMWQPLQVYFAPGRVDHHSVQILLLTIVVLALASARDGWRSGAVAGIATAFSLAVGLETLIALGLAGLLLSMRAVWRPTAYSKALFGYAWTLGPVSLALFALQTHPHHWFARHCDQLALPLLVPLLAASCAAAALAWSLPRLDRTGHRVAAFAALYGTALAIGGPMLLACASGPYSALPPEVEEAIYTQINEAKPLLVVIADLPSVFHMTAVPLVVALVAATGMWCVDKDAQRRDTAGTLLIFGWISVFAMLYQLRMIVIAAAVLPMLTGYVVGWSLSDMHRPRVRLRATSVAAVIGLTSVFYPFAWAKAYALRTTDAPIYERPEATRASRALECRTHETLATLRNLPPGTVFSTMNLSPSILLSSGHSILVAPYHRSASAMSNGLLPFDMAAEAFRETMRRIGADYVVFCRGIHEKGFVRNLSEGGAVEGFHRVEGLAPVLAVYEVSR